MRRILCKTVEVTSVGELALKEIQAFTMLLISRASSEGRSWLILRNRSK